MATDKAKMLLKKPNLKVCEEAGGKRAKPLAQR
jgi:hypothetical protein